MMPRWLIAVEGVSGVACLYNSTREPDTWWGPPSWLLLILGVVGVCVSLIGVVQHSQVEESP